MHLKIAIALVKIIISKVIDQITLERVSHLRLGHLPVLTVIIPGTLTDSQEVVGLDSRVYKGILSMDIPWPPG